MKLYYDLHIHSALSPCASDDMTPNNIVNMCVLKGLDIIAVTDHNSARNVEAISKLGREKRPFGGSRYGGANQRRSSRALLLSYFGSLLRFSSEVGRVSAKGEEWMKTTNWSVNTLTYC